MYPKFTVSPIINSPASNFSFFVIRLKKVVFPAPLGPIIPIIDPGGTLKDKFSINNFFSKDFFIFFTLMTILPSRSPIGIVIC